MNYFLAFPDQCVTPEELITFNGGMSQALNTEIQLGHMLHIADHRNGVVDCGCVSFAKVSGDQILSQKLQKELAHPFATLADWKVDGDEKNLARLFPYWIYPTYSSVWYAVRKPPRLELKTASHLVIKNIPKLIWSTTIVHNSSLFFQPDFIIQGIVKNEDSHVRSLNQFFDTFRSPWEIWSWRKIKT